MMKRIFTVTLVSLSLFSVSYAQTSQERKERIQASYLIAFGVLPQQSELDYWMSDPLSLKTGNDLVEKHRSNIAGNIQLKYKAINNSYLDAIGRYPSPDDVNHWKKGNETYAELMTKHVQWLAGNPSEFEKTINLSYLREFNRNAQAAEIKSWKNAGARSYLNIVMEHRKNKAKGLFDEKKKANLSKAPAEIKLSDNIAKEINKISAAKVISTGGGNVISTGGGNVISTGGGNVISTGGGN